MTPQAMTVASVALRSGANDAYVVDENGGSIANGYRRILPQGLD